MQTTSAAETGHENAGATRFFWLWLIAATAMSVTGNVTHAVLTAVPDRVALASGAALVPPLVLLAATHSIAVLVRTRAGGLTYWCALVMTCGLASCAFVLSFDALRSLAILLGLPLSIAWLWPCAIDVAIAQATLCLLSLNRRSAMSATGTPAAHACSAPEATGASGSSDLPDAPRSKGPARKRVAGRNAPPQDVAVLKAVNTADIHRWQPVAESLVRDGVTAKDPQLVAAILAQREAGIPPSTIGRTHNVHHTTVGRILSAARALTA
jgi:hypothetical protein